jgi:hypothetical protein
MEIVWQTEKVVDDREVITHIKWTATLYAGLHEKTLTGTVELPPPDPALLAAYLAQPTPEQAKNGVTWADLPDPDGFKRPEWIERDTLHPWLFGLIDREAIEAELKAQLAEARPPEPLEADDLPIPEFLKTPEGPPPDLADLIEYADTPAETNEKLLVRLREVLGLIGLAEDAGGRAAPELYRKKDRLESGIRWNRGRLAGTI